MWKAIWNAVWTPLARALALLVPAAATLAAQRPAASGAVALDTTTRLVLENARAVWVDYRGRRALELAPRVGHEHDTDQAMAAVLADSDFGDGVIEVDVSGARR